MDNKKLGYTVKKYHQPVKRYCQVLNLCDDKEMIEAYKQCHSQASVWDEVLQNIHDVGILEMEIYACGTQVFMIVETPLNFDWDKAMEKFATLPRQAEWEARVAKLQGKNPNLKSDEKWHLMNRIFHLYK